MSIIPQPTLLHFQDTTRSSGPRNTRNRLNRYHEVSHDCLMQDYSVEKILGDEVFKRRFQMRRELFFRIVCDIVRYSPYFRLYMDARNKWNFTLIQKWTSVVNQLACETFLDVYNDYLNMSKIISIFMWKSTTFL